jgi:ABC-type multidrug transport system fused ATPase/permease subunit
MLLVMGFLDTAGVASIMPFMAVLANPQLVQTNSALSFLYSALGFTDMQYFLFALGVLVFVTLLASLAFKAATTYAQLRFVLMREHAIARRLVAGYLHQPYSWFLNRHSADLGKNVLSEVNLVVNGVLMPLMTLIANGVVALALLLLVFLVHSNLALFVVTVLGAAYGLIYAVMGGFLSKIGRDRKIANQQRFTVLAEAFSAMKEIKIAGLEGEYAQRFSRPAESYARQQSAAAAISLMPRFVLEGIAFGGMLLAILYLMRGPEGFASGLPVIALFAFAGYRLIPALQQVYASLTQLRYSGPALDALHADFAGLARSAASGNDSGRLVLADAISVRGVSYTYPQAGANVIENFNLEIPVRSTVAFVGSTGSGKTTIVDLIMGLLEPTAGVIEVDGIPITGGNLRKWQRSIGYVPQQIFLADDTVAANIAFGVTAEKIDIAAVERASHIANLHDFVAFELPDAYATTVGERGVRLSGGQRQRIGIARALYHNPQVLVLDEATSALDNLTERAVMEAVHNIGNKMTIILIAHRLTTVRNCDCIFLLEHGRVAGKGNFDQLLDMNEGFRRLANSIT